MTELDNFEKEMKIIDLGKANIYSVIGIVPVVLIYFLPFYLLWKENLTVAHLKAVSSEMSSVFFGMSSTLIVLLIMIIGIAVHELIHGLSWSLFATQGFKSMKFGFMVKTLTPYCHCKEPLKVKHYITGAMMPFVLLGLFPAIIAILTGNILLLLFGTFFTVAAMGDFMIVSLIRNEDSNSLVQDHPTEAGCYIYREKLAAK
jgi:hypothetical protein